MLRGGRGALAFPLLFGALLLAYPALSSSPYWIEQIPLIAVLALVVSGVNLSFGYAGELQLGQVFMFALGAYVSMILAVHGFTDIVALMLIGGIAAVLVGVCSCGAVSEDRRLVPGAGVVLPRSHDPGPCIHL